MRQGRFISTAVTALAALAIAPAAAWAASSPLVDDDFTGGTADANAWVVEPGSLRLKPAVSANFEGSALPSEWTATPWESPPTGTATVANGALKVDHARVNTAAAPSATNGVLEFRATFSNGEFEHVGFGDTFENPPWAMFSTGGGSLPVGLYARTLTAPEHQTALPASINPTQPHVYRIVWTATEVNYFVDSQPVATHAVAVPGPMRPVISDIDPTPDPNPLDTVAVDWIAQSPYPTSGTFESRMLEADDARAVWGSLTATPAAGVTFATRSGNSAATMSAYQPVGPSGAIQSPPGKFIQYKATLTTADASATPTVDSVSISYAIDSAAPTTTIGGTGTTVTFSSPDADVARFECSVDGGAFVTCTSPREFPGLSVGSHTVSVRAIDRVGNVGPAVSRTLIVSGQGGGGTPGGGDDDTTAPDVTIGSRKLRASKSGKVKLRLTCPDDEGSCEIVVRLKRKGKTLAGKILTLPGGESKTVKLKLSNKMRRKLTARGRLKAKAVITASDESGNEDRTKYSVTLRPR